MNAETAKERGFVDEVTEEGAKEAAMAWGWLDEAGQLSGLRQPPIPDAVVAAIVSELKADPPIEREGPTEEPRVESVSDDACAASSSPVVVPDHVDPQPTATTPVQQQLPLVAMLPFQNPGAPGRKKGSAMVDLRGIASALQLGADADGNAVLAAVERTVKERNEAISQRNTLLQAAGVATVEEGVGLITAGVAALDSSRALAARVEGLEKSAEDQKRTDIIGRIRSDGKCTPAMEISVFPAMSTAALEHFEKAAPRVIGKTGIREPARGSHPEVMPTWNGKTWEQMKPLEKYQLGRENIDLFNAMRECAR